MPGGRLPETTSAVALGSLAASLALEVVPARGGNARARLVEEGRLAVAGVHHGDGSSGRPLDRDELVGEPAASQVGRDGAGRDGADEPEDHGVVAQRAEDAGDVDPLAAGPFLDPSHAVARPRSELVDPVGDVEGDVGCDGEDHGASRLERLPGQEGGAEDAGLVLQGGGHQPRLPDHAEVATQCLADRLEEQLPGSGQPAAEEDRLRREHDGGPGQRQRQRRRGVGPDPPGGRVAGGHPFRDLLGIGHRSPGGGRVAAGDRGGGGDRLDAATPPAGARFPVAQVDVTDLARVAAAADEPSLDDDPGRDARADGDEDQVLESLAGAQAPLRQGPGPDVVAEADRQPGRPLDQGPDGYVPPADVLRVHGQSTPFVDDAGDHQPDAVDAGVPWRRRRELVDRGQDRGQDLAGPAVAGGVGRRSRDTTLASRSTTAPLIVVPPTSRAATQSVGDRGIA